MKKTLSYALIATVIAGCGIAANSKTTKADIQRNLMVFNEIYKELQTNYVDTLNAQKNIRVAIDAMLGNIDPYTEFYTEDEQDKINSVSSGEYGGIGSVVMRRDSVVEFSSPRWGTPSRNVGIHHGDIVLKIDDTDITKDVNIEDVSSRLRGQPGTEVRVKVRRRWLPEGSDSILDFNIVRQSIKIEPVPYYGRLKDNESIGYINVTTFNENTASDFRKALENLRSAGNLKGLVIDLRDNGGGILDGAVALASNFVPRGTSIVTVRYRDPKSTKTYKTTTNPIEPDLPMVVLVNSNTASASEIFSGALQDLDRAVIVGERSYGKGLVQSVRPVPYNGLMKITTGRYYIPSGRLIQSIDYSHRNPDGTVARTPDSLTNVFHTRVGREVRDGGGITPDVKVKLPDGNRLLYNIVADNWVYDFANRTANNMAAPDADTWQVSDSLFTAFKSFIDPARFKYDRASDAGIKYMRDAARIEGYESPEVLAAIDSLERLMKHDLQHDLDFNRKEIEEYLDNELSTRWYDDATVIRRSLRDDPYIREAVNVLADLRQYGVLLSKPKENGK
ncbi:MAG: S41 family peptidase [Muribaculaceae bacterium]